MSDLTALLHRAADAVPVAPAATVVDADLARGRDALARSRRVRWTAAPIGIGAAAVAGLIFAVPHLTTAAPGAVAIGDAPTRSSSAAPRTLDAAISLVAYTGKQPAGYTVDRVPDGWAVQGVDPYSLVIAPIGTKDTDPSSFEGKITIGKANQDEIAVERPGPQTKLRVGDVTARLFTFPAPMGPQPGARADQQRAHASPQSPQDPEGTRGLLLPVGKGAYLIFQLPGTLHWDDATVADFAAGVHMNPGARAAAG